MHPSPYPSRLGTTDPDTPAAATPALHLLAGIWIASCPTCGYQLCTARTQARVERRSRRRRCPVCHQDATP
jgi:hypothetical protein